MRDLSDDVVRIEEIRDESVGPTRVANAMAHPRIPLIAASSALRSRVNLEAMLQSAHVELEYIANLQAYSASTERLEKRLKYAKDERTKGAILEELLSHLENELPRKRSADGTPREDANETHETDENDQD